MATRKATTKKVTRKKATTRRKAAPRKANAEAAQEETDDEPEPDTAVAVRIRPIETKMFECRIIGTSRLVVNRKQMTGPGALGKTMEDKITGAEQEAKRKGKNVRTPRQKKQVFEASKYKFPNGREGIPAAAVKKALVAAAHDKRGFSKVNVRQSVFVIADGDSKEGMPLIALEKGKAIMHEALVNVGSMGKQVPDLRWRASYPKWSAMVRIKYVTDTAAPEAIINLLERAGITIGLCEGRPEKGAGLEWGQFLVEIPKARKRRARSS
jgi:hypothetical protein